MAKYRFSIVRTESIIVDVEAESEESATAIVDDAVYGGDYSTEVTNALERTSNFEVDYFCEGAVTRTTDADLIIEP